MAVGVDRPGVLVQEGIFGPVGETVMLGQSRAAHTPGMNRQGTSLGVQGS